MVDETTPRDPFWPIGWRPQKVVVKQTNEVPVKVVAPVTKFDPTAVTWPALKIQGITKGPKGTYFAMIQDIGVVEPGETITLTRDNVVFRWNVEEITKTGIKCQKLDARQKK